MTNFEKITATPEALAALLGSLNTLDGPWDAAFCRKYCAACKAKNCADEDTVCLAPEIRKDQQSMAAWWLGLEADA